MIHMITAENRHLYRAELREMHQLRRVHFVEERGWSQLTVRDGGEYDSSDDDRAIYFLALDAEGNIARSGSCVPRDDHGNDAKTKVTADSVGLPGSLYGTIQYLHGRGKRMAPAVAVCTTDAITLSSPP